MIDHIGVRVKDVKKSTRLYAAALEPLGHTLCSEYEGGAGFGPSKDATSFWLVETKTGGGAHVALKAKSRAAVDAFYKAALAAGARDNGPPGVRTDYSPTYYAAFIVDLDSNNVEAVCHT
jgi:catechol 2,3-dioxygenase-like lactoylglutathione lyase family enzyme